MCADPVSFNINILQVRVGVKDDVWTRLQLFTTAKKKKSWKLKWTGEQLISSLSPKKRNKEKS